VASPPLLQGTHDTTGGREAPAAVARGGSPRRKASGGVHGVRHGGGERQAWQVDVSGAHFDFYGVGARGATRSKTGLRGLWAQRPAGGRSVLGAPLAVVPWCRFPPTRPSPSLSLCSWAQRGGAPPLLPSVALLVARWLLPRFPPTRSSLSLASCSWAWSGGAPPPCYSLASRSPLRGGASHTALLSRPSSFLTCKSP